MHWHDWEEVRFQVALSSNARDVQCDEGWSIFYDGHTLPQFSFSLFTLQFEPLNSIL